MLLLSSSIRVPTLEHNGAKVWDALAIAEYLNELKPRAALLPAERRARAHCRSICGEMHNGFASLRAALPMNLKGRFPGFRIWARAQADIDRIVAIWNECLDACGVPFLFGKRTAEAMYAPVVTRFISYDVKLDPACAAYCQRVMAMPEMAEWIELAQREQDSIEELEVEFRRAHRPATAPDAPARFALRRDRASCTVLVLPTPAAALGRDRRAARP